ncbi:peptidoglycan DD-metalloendopeptidase family protein [Niveibacterium umoris]|uniref:Murein DD-endopeptidase MepM/ murein hydrolase activator NlpD n=1 Tax=Niveibacterium umoris TaxID=1193620 RepID=A0A840BXA3_9RHOO|nr:peptidoglycan DD-metalloendopeptidase family protein [Niveibacterium umoris]MBB4014937.1 murein DD-endopeptidase MepM/ murein hydrolase activator NlpD [Niveibacterium umoris]
MSHTKVSILARLKGLREQGPLWFWSGVGIAGASVFGMVAAVAVIPGPDSAALRQKSVIEDLLVAPEAEVLPDDAAFFREERIQRGDTLASLLARLNIDDPEVADMLRTHSLAQAAMRRLSPGAMVNASMTAGGRVLSLALPGSSSDHQLLVERRDGSIVVRDAAVRFDTRIQAKSAEIRSSLFGATDDAGLPDSVAVGLAEIFSSEIDFHRDLRKGDRFRVVYEVLYHRGMPVKTGRILGAEFINDGQRHTAIWNDRGGRGDYYTAEGKSLKRGFLRSPLEFSRVTSGMGMRMHPIYGTMKQHKGVDYGAPIGTHVRSTADGSVEFAGRQGGYGNFIVLKHAGGITTAYGHLSRIDVRQGQRVHQGDTIGAVGNTGSSTGPHLHYEFRVAGEHKDPLKVVLPDAPPLSGNELARFRQHSAAVIAQLGLAEPSRVARAE